MVKQPLDSDETRDAAVALTCACRYDDREGSHVQRPLTFCTVFVVVCSPPLPGRPDLDFPATIHPLCCCGQLVDFGVATPLGRLLSTRVNSCSVHSCRWRHSSMAWWLETGKEKIMPVATIMEAFIEGDTIFLRTLPASA
uniref:Uncharacterized protein n=1 Tax=Oryza punctata TaxID=4537 RepID=A0A0E0KN20_ORYPU